MKELFPSENPELWEFPCQLMLKVMAVKRDGIEADIVSAVQKYAPGTYAPKVRPSSKGNYLSLTLSVQFTSKGQLDHVYYEIGQVEGVKMCL